MVNLDLLIHVVSACKLQTDVVGQDDTCHLLEDDEIGCQVNEQEQTEAMVAEKGTRTPILATA